MLGQKPVTNVEALDTFLGSAQAPKPHPSSSSGVNKLVLRDIWLRHDHQTIPTTATKATYWKKMSQDALNIRELKQLAQYFTKPAVDQY